jgi:hypothetical protein
MGNHVAGQAVGLAAEHALSTRVEGETAMAILDRVCRKYHGADAEWESEDPAKPGSVHPDYEAYTDPHPKAALGMLMIEAFAPNGLADLPRYAPMIESEEQDVADAAYDLWWAEVSEPFDKRFGFC